MRNEIMHYEYLQHQINVQDAQLKLARIQLESAERETYQLRQLLYGGGFDGNMLPERERELVIAIVTILKGELKTRQIELLTHPNEIIRTYAKLLKSEEK